MLPEIAMIIAMRAAKVAGEVMREQIARNKADSGNAARLRARHRDPVTARLDAYHPLLKGWTAANADTLENATLSLINGGGLADLTSKTPLKCVHVSGSSPRTYVSGSPEWTRTMTMEFFDPHVRPIQIELRHDRAFNIDGALTIQCGQRHADDQHDDQPIKMIG